jgi:hypothetical protein
VVSNAAGFNLISDDADNFSKYNSPRGLDVNKNPNTANFGTIYISNSAAAAAAGRSLGDGLYAIRADRTDAFAYGDTAKNPINTTDSFAAFNESGTGTNSPYRLTVGNDGNVYVADYSDINGWAFVVTPNLTSATNLVKDFGGPATPLGPDGTALPAGQNHGSISSIWVEGSLATNDLKLYAMDEDINSAHFGGTEQNDRNSLWRWDVNGTPNSTVTPVQIAKGVASLQTAAPKVPAPNGLIGDFPPGGIIVDMTRGPTGKWYLSQNRSNGDEPGLIITDPAGAVLFNSLEASRTLLANPTSVDIFRGMAGIDISPDGKWLAALHINNDVSLIPLDASGLPVLTNRLLVDGGSNTGNGRDIAFDLAGNLHYVTSGLALYRSISPGGHTVTTLSYNGTTYAFESKTLANEDANFDDFNGVNDADFAIWKTGFGGAATGTTGDANGDSLANGRDFLVWQRQYGQAQAAAAVPEPAAWCSAVVAALALAVVAAPRRRLAAQAVNR